MTNYGMYFPLLHMYFPLLRQREYIFEQKKLKRPTEIAMNAAASSDQEKIIVSPKILDYHRNNSFNVKVSLLFAGKLYLKDVLCNSFRYNLFLDV